MASDKPQMTASLRKISGDARWDAVVKIGEEWAVSYPFETGLYVTGFASKEDADLIAEMLAREGEGTASLWQTY